MLFLTWLKDTLKEITLNVFWIIIIWWPQKCTTTEGTWNLPVSTQVQSAVCNEFKIFLEPLSLKFILKEGSSGLPVGHLTLQHSFIWTQFRDCWKENGWRKRVLLFIWWFTRREVVTLLYCISDLIQLSYF